MYSSLECSPPSWWFSSHAEQHDGFEHRRDGGEKGRMCKDPGARSPRGGRATGRPRVFGDPTGYTLAQ